MFGFDPWSDISTNPQKKTPAKMIPEKTQTIFRVSFAKIA
jgi:hypothetical protein